MLSLHTWSPCAPLINVVESIFKRGSIWDVLGCGGLHSRMLAYIYIYIYIINYIYMFFQCVLWCSKCEAYLGYYHTNGIQPVVKNNQRTIKSLIHYIWLCLEDVLSVTAPLLQGTVWFSIKLEVLSVRFGHVLSVRFAPNTISVIFFSKLCSKCLSVTILALLWELCGSLRKWRLHRACPPVIHGRSVHLAVAELRTYIFVGRHA